MYVIAGATGNVGSVAAERLLAAKEPVRVLVRDEAKGKRFADQGADVAVGTLDDEAFVAAALKGAEGAFLLLPPNFAADDFPAYQRKIADAVSAAVKVSGVPHVVLLSSIGADRESGLGPIAGLHYFEGKLRETGTKLSALRPGYFTENVAMGLEPARGQGIYPSFMPRDAPMPMVATCDIGTEVARVLLDPPDSSQVVDIVGPAYTALDVAKQLGERLGKPIDVMPIPPEGWVDAMTQNGVPKHFAELYAEMYAGFGKGLAQPVGDRLVEGKTSLETVVGGLLAG
ncbi:MAG: NmrA family NAD(P)-binding protein [Deltaproteobacteria bacterium]|jgi:uncharacterized protein YbjT (DUF2867 family)|nr:NmrA family NAD(P)-binding protein [Deltaproteobacteria bacterium]MBW2530581.1 NmrA family NAD(P)-binding protein [Deltaproteobacteria bacterium]